ncbi:MAG: Gfo/Idh/MocA family oxidoreductase, partial [Fimbriimonadaceae bacterium]|nr:Gfo/Idh/MocA family oxidoreductase [Fimbriimonadaceae bacterium]
SDKKIAGGVLHDWGAHFIDWGLQIIKSPIVGVFGHLRGDAWPEATLEDYGQALVKFEDNTVLDITIGNILSLHQPMWQVLGTKGCLSWHWGEKVKVKFNHNDRLASYEVDPVADQGGHAYYENVADHLYNGAELIVKAEEIRRVIGVIEAAEKSSSSGKLETV